MSKLIKYIMVSTESHCSQLQKPSKSDSRVSSCLLKYLGDLNRYENVCGVNLERCSGSLLNTYTCRRLNMTFCISYFQITPSCSFPIEKIILNFAKNEVRILWYGILRDIFTLEGGESLCSETLMNKWPSLASSSCGNTALG